MANSPSVRWRSPVIQFEIMLKDFDGWNSEKKKINDAPFTGYIHEREIWWCSLGVNVGAEQDGKNERFERPVLVLKKFNRHIVLAVPLTTKLKPNPYYFPFTHEELSSRSSSPKSGFLAPTDSLAEFER